MGIEASLKIEQFFEALHGRKKSFEDNYRYFAPQLAPRFNVFDFIRPDEMRLSEIIAALLSEGFDPAYPQHSQGDAFFQLFMLKLGYADFECAAKIKVQLEVQTYRIENANRRIDILVEFGDKDFCLAIENKPWAKDQEKQLEDYGLHLGSSGYKDWLLVYLHGNGAEASEYSLSGESRKKLVAEKHYREIGFDFIVEWLIQCEAQAKADHVRHFLRDFIAYCERNFLGVNDMADGQLIKEFALKPENLALALEIAQQGTAIKKELYSKLKHSIEVTMARMLPDWQVEFPSDFAVKWTETRFFKADWKKYALGISFDQHECNLALYGVIKRDPNFADIPKTREFLPCKSTIWWPCWQYFPTPYLNWKNETQPWVDIVTIDTNGESVMSKMLVEQYLKPLAVQAIPLIEEAEKL